MAERYSSLTHIDTMLLRTKIVLSLGTLIIAFVALVVYYLKYSLQEGFEQEIKHNLSILAEANDRSYTAFSHGLKMRALDWSSEGITRGFAETIFDTQLSVAIRKKAMDDFSIYMRGQRMPYDNRVIMVELLDAQGIVVASTNEDRIGVDERQEEINLGAHYFSKAIKGSVGEVFIRSGVFESDESSKQMSHATVRMFSNKKDSSGKPLALPGVFLVHFTPLESFTELINNRQLFATSTVSHGNINRFGTTEFYMVNRDGQIIVAPGSSAVGAVGRIIATQPVQACFNRGKDVSGEYVGYRGYPVLGISACLYEEGVVLLNEISLADAHGFMRGLIVQTMIGGGILLVGLVAFTAFFSRRLLRNVYLMVDAATAVAGGDLRKRVPVLGKDEVGRLAGSFNVMLETISVSQDKLKESEKKLAQKAEELAADLDEHKKQSQFIEQSKRATQNLLEDAWENKEKLEIERNRLQTILSSIGDGLVLVDLHYMIILVNPKMVEFFRIPVIDLVGKDIRVIMKLIKSKKGELSPTEWPIEEMFLTKRIVVTDLDDELSLVTEKRTLPLPITLSVAPLIGDNGETTGGVIVIRDVTEDRGLDEAKSGFISVASHQLRTPLTTIRWYSEMLLSDDVGRLTKQQKDFLNEIHGGAERLYQTIDLLLGISRVESGKLKIEKKPINLTLFTADLEKELGPQMNEKKLDFSILPPEGDPTIVYLDPLALRQVVLNLVSNAIRYTNEHGVIDVAWSANKAKGEVTYSVRDDGIGIPPAQHSRIFSKFFRAENALSKVPDGSGLGLALVKELVVAWGGRVWFETKEGKGTTFFFTIPFSAVD